MRSPLVVAGLFCTVAGNASAQENAPFLGGRSEGDPVEVLAPRNAFEIAVNGGFTQPFGELSEGREIGDMIDAGGAVSVDLGYRAMPSLSVGAGVLFHESTADTMLGVANSFRGGTAAIQVTYHFIPYEIVDPYVSFATGYRVLWSTLRGIDNDSFDHGLQIGRLLVGVDFRTSRDAAVGPFLSADANVMLFENPEVGPARTIVRPGVHTFLAAGVMARFDVGGTREQKPRPEERHASR